MTNTTKQNRRSIRWVLAAAVAGPVLGLLAPSAEAQYRTPNSDGSMRDANNRVGGTGRNEGPSRYGSGVTPDMIIYGNVTNNKYFRGPIGAPDARAFRGNTGAETSDRFIRDSTGGYDRNTYSFNPAPYYGDARAVQAPAGYVPTKTTFSGSQTTTPFSSPFSSSANLPSLNTGEGLIPKLGSTITALPAPGGVQDGPLLSMSPLGGIRQVAGGESDSAGDLYVIRGSELVPAGGSQMDRFRTDGQLINRIRDELIAPQPNQSREAKPETPPNGLGQPLGAPPEAPAPSQLSPAALPSGALNSGALSSTANTGQSSRRQLLTPGQQSEQMSELERRLRQAQGDKPISDQEAQQQLQQQMRNAAAAKKAAGGTTPATPGAATPGAATPGAATPGAATPGAPAPAAPRAEPMAIKSLATGVKVKALADVLTNAEGLMKQGKFAEALDQYDLAERGAPNNPLITLGRANAELGGSSYRSAATHLRSAIGEQPALLLGRYDLNGMIGAERLAVLTKDLTDLSAKEPTETIAPFLLSYIHYNTGNEAAAAASLAEVEKRTNGGDPLTARMRQLWSLPSGNLNK